MKSKILFLTWVSLIIRYLPSKTSFLLKNKFWFFSNDDSKELLPSKTERVNLGSFAKIDGMLSVGVFSDEFSWFLQNQLIFSQTPIRLNFGKTALPQKFVMNLMFIWNNSKNLLILLLPTRASFSGFLQRGLARKFLIWSSYNFKAYESLESMDLLGLTFL